ncbi:hypothetical protein MPDQ_007457 [Monascus purpureus]|uniref:Uncharacterized protein n=1 Tax=Monascus purpureus TaxID=5098 RepID=A0A507QS31_MONPU|nr:hypothetical protein MPDQ_007457 [Monascus purpureus]
MSDLEQLNREHFSKPIPGERLNAFWKTARECAKEFKNENLGTEPRSRRGERD